MRNLPTHALLTSEGYEFLENYHISEVEDTLEQMRLSDPSGVYKLGEPFYDGGSFTISMMDEGYVGIYRAGGRGSRRKTQTPSLPSFSPQSSPGWNTKREVVHTGPRLHTPMCSG